MEGWEDDEDYYVPVPQEGSVTLFAFLSPESRLARLLSKYGTVSSSPRGVGIPIEISCRTSNISIALLKVERLKGFLESFASEERAFLTRVARALPARKVILKVVPSRFMFKKIEEAKLFKDHAESVIPLRIVDDVNYFVDYVSSLTRRPPPMLLGPIYTEAKPLREKGRINAVEILLNYRGQRVAAYRIRLVIPENPGKTVRALAYSATGQWGIDHKFCAREMLTTLREDLLQYVDWKKRIEKEKDKPAA
ncbi:MAG: hypothetical protein QXU11_11555 [Thermoproteota archaeon]